MAEAKSEKKEDFHNRDIDRSSELFENKVHECKSLNGDITEDPIIPICFLNPIHGYKAGYFYLISGRQLNEINSLLLHDGKIPRGNYIISSDYRKIIDCVSEAHKTMFTADEFEKMQLKSPISRSSITEVATPILAQDRAIYDGDILTYIKNKIGENPTKPIALPLSPNEELTHLVDLTNDPILALLKTGGDMRAIRQVQSLPSCEVMSMHRFFEKALRRGKKIVLKLGSDNDVEAGIQSLKNEIDRLPLFTVIEQLNYLLSINFKAGWCNYLKLCIEREISADLLDRSTDSSFLYLMSFALSWLSSYLPHTDFTVDALLEQDELSLDNLQQGQFFYFRGDVAIKFAQLSAQSAQEEKQDFERIGQVANG